MYVYTYVCMYVYTYVCICMYVDIRLYYLQVILTFISGQSVQNLLYFTNGKRPVHLVAYRYAQKFHVHQLQVESVCDVSGICFVVKTTEVQ